MSAYANVPLRLSDGERGLLGVLQGALHVSEYTDKVDTIRWNKEQRILEELQEILDQISGLLTCHNYKLGQSIALCSYADNAVFFRNLFEIARRYKVGCCCAGRKAISNFTYRTVDRLCIDYEPGENAVHIRKNDVLPAGRH